MGKSGNKLGFGTFTYNMVDNAGNTGKCSVYIINAPTRGCGTYKEENWSNTGVCSGGYSHCSDPDPHVCCRWIQKTCSNGTTSESYCDPEYNKYGNYCYK